MAMLASLMRDKSLHETILLREMYPAVESDGYRPLVVQHFNYDHHVDPRGQDEMLACITTGCMRLPLA